MWRTVGTVNPHEPKHNKSREEVTLEPFAQASRLKLNESHLSGDNHQRFMGEYFGRKRASEGTLQRVLSHKQIEPRPFVSPPNSLREVNSPRFHPIENNSSLKNINSDHNLVDSIEGNSLVEAPAALPPPKAASTVPKTQSDAIKGDLKAVKAEQASLRKAVNSELVSFQKAMEELQREVRGRLEALQAEREKEKREGVNPELLARIRQEGSRFNERMKQMDSRKQQIREKYRAKMQNV